MIIFSVHIYPYSWELHRGIVPPEEDYFDYAPVQAALCSVSEQFLTLTREDVGKFQFRDFKVCAKPRGLVFLFGILEAPLRITKAPSGSIKLYCHKHHRIQGIKYSVNYSDPHVLYNT